MYHPVHGAKMFPNPESIPTDDARWRDTPYPEGGKEEEKNRQQESEDAALLKRLEEAHRREQAKEEQKRISDDLKARSLITDFEGVDEPKDK
jgi:hypothetical protein